MDARQRRVLGLFLPLLFQWLLRENEISRAEMRNRAASSRRRRMAFLFYVMHRRRANNVLRGATYCQMEFLAPEVSQIFNRDTETTKKHLRVNADSFLLFCTKLNERNNKSWGWSIEFAAMVFLYWLATGVCFRVVAVSFNLARSTTHMLCIKTLNMVVAMTHELILLPVAEELHAIGQGFAALGGSPVFSCAVGAIDGCQVRTLVPTALHDQYINRKLYYAINLQGLVDHNGMFLDINAGFPGSVHDMRVLRHSYLWRLGTYPPAEHYILGDGGYKTCISPICIVTPFKAPLTPNQSNFNHHHSQARSIVERSFGMMQVRWRCIFTKALEVKLRTGVKVITACAVMHNICTTAGDILRVNVQNRQPPRREERDEADGVAFRNILLNLHTAYRNQ